MSDFAWTPAAIKRLTELWLGGYSGGEIGRRMGVSRSGIMGKLRRLDLLCRARPRMPIMPRRAAAQLLKTTEQVSKPPQKPKIRRNKRRANPDSYFLEYSRKPPPLPPEPPAYGTLNLMDLRLNSCRWPSDGDSPWTFCGRPQAGDSSYCPEHHARSRSGGPGRPAQYFNLSIRAAG